MKRNNLIKALLAGVFITTSGWATAQSLEATTTEETNNNWYKESPYGIDLTGAKSKLKEMKPSKVVVAVIGTGVDLNHRDLKGKIWTNTKEIPNNGIDDDKNGYVDDVNGWNFIGLPDGSSIIDHSSEADREFLRLAPKFLPLSPEEAGKKFKGEKGYFIDTVAIKSEIGQLYMSTYVMNLILHKAKGFHKVLEDKFPGQTTFTADEFMKNIPTPTLETDSIGAIAFVYIGTSFSLAQSMTFTSIIEKLPEMISSQNAKYEKEKTALVIDRSKVGDKLSDVADRYKGNNNVNETVQPFSTAIAGIIGAIEGNDQDIDGINPNALIMPIKILSSPEADPYDKDIANAIRYAVDNGAKVIDLMVSKSLTRNPAWVNDAIDYARKKDVVIVLCSGDDNSDMDLSPMYPAKKYTGTTDNSGFLKVGAIDSEGFPAVFSNYGSKSVDVFAPGMEIFTLMPEDKCLSLNSSIAASAVTTGVASLLRSYFPTLKASEIITIIKESVDSKKGVDVVLPHTPNMMSAGKEIGDFGKLSSSGGTLNASKAVDLAKMKLTK